MRQFILIVIFLISGCGPNVKIKEESKSNEEVKKANAIVTIKNLEAKKHFIQGLSYSLQDLPEKAIIEFQEALMFEDNPNINFALAVQLYKINKLDLSMKYLEKIIALPDSQIHTDFLLFAAQLNLTKGNFQNAINLLERVIKIDSSNIDALYNLAQLIENKDKERAKSLYEKVLQIQPENRLALESLLNFYYEERDYNNSERLLKNLIFNEPFEVELRHRLIGLYREWGKTDSAKKTLNEILERFPDDILSKLYLIEICIEEKKYSEAIDLSKKAISLSVETYNKITVYDYILAQSIKDTNLRDSVFLLLNDQLKVQDSLANTYLFLISLLYDSAQIGDKFFSMIKFDETNLEILKKFGQQFYFDEKYDQAIKVLKKIYNFYENDFNVNVIIGQAFLIKENYDEALVYLKKSEKLNPQNPELLTTISFVLGKLKRVNEAIEYSEKALSIDNKNRNALINLGLLLDDNGYFNKCDSLYEEALRIYPDDPTLLNNYAYSLAKRKVNLDKALEMSKKSLEKDSLVGSYLDTMGWIYFQMGRLGEAERYIKLAIEQGSPSSEILEHMGDVYASMSKKEEAIEYYKMALELNPENESLKEKLEKIK